MRAGSSWAGPHAPPLADKGRSSRRACAQRERSLPITKAGTVAAKPQPSSLPAVPLAVGERGAGAHSALDVQHGGEVGQVAVPERECAWLGGQAGGERVGQLGFDQVEGEGVVEEAADFETRNSTVRVCGLPEGLHRPYHRAK